MCFRPVEGYGRPCGGGGVTEGKREGCYKRYIYTAGEGEAKSITTVHRGLVVNAANNFSEQDTRTSINLCCIK